MRPDTIGVVFKRQYELQRQIDAFLKREGIEKSFTADAKFGGIMIYELQRQVDALFKALGVGKALGFDAVLLGLLAVSTQAATDIGWVE